MKSLLYVIYAEELSRKGVHWEDI
ncbi:unnamed protein product [Larinioides sclopetarius]|uniref:Uncharacterized protein n=1 Tax=Larinioides sclopetarius TaxID=280406 RepID=A0AAV2AVU0_9ARAC